MRRERVKIIALIFISFRYSNAYCLCEGLTVTCEGLGYVSQQESRMFWLYPSVTLTLLVFTQRNQALENADAQVKESNLEQIKSPMLEVFMRFPPNAKSFKNSQQSLKRATDFDSKWNQKNIVDVRNYEIVQPVYLKNPKKTSKIIAKRETDSEEVKLNLEKPKKLVSSLVGSQNVLPLPDAIRSSVFTTYPVKEFDVVDIDDPDDPRRRRNDSSDGPDDNSQRDKRTFLEEGSGETTTPLPFWKRKKENPPFVTGRGGPVKSGNSYTPAQHRSENARESHSLKNLDKTVQSNEITRSNQDNYYSATNRRTYSRQYDTPPSSTPKSVYDTIDYTHKRHQGSGQVEFGRNQDSGRNQDGKKETIRPTHEQYTNRFPYNFPWMYDRPYYQPPYPYPTEVFGRGVEYYHRTYDPTTGRIIYYANMPEHGRSYEYRVMDPINRNFYVNRPYYDPYYRNYVPPFDYRFVNGYGRSNDYTRNGRSSSQAYSYPFQEREKFPRDARFSGTFETGNRVKDEFRNKTYIIYDAEERRSQHLRPQLTFDSNRPGYPLPNNNLPGLQVPFRQFYPVDDFPPAVFPSRTQFDSSSPGHAWGFNHRSAPGIRDSNLNSRPLNSPEVQLPLTTTSDRGDSDKSKKS